MSKISKTPLANSLGSQSIIPKGFLEHTLVSKGGDTQMISIYQHLDEDDFTEIVKKAKKRQALCQIFQKDHHQPLQAHEVSFLKGPKSTRRFQKVEWPKCFPFINVCTRLVLQKSSKKHKRGMPYVKNLKKPTLKLSRLVAHHS